MKKDSLDKNLNTVLRVFLENKDTPLLASEILEYCTGCNISKNELDAFLEYFFSADLITYDVSEDMKYSDGGHNKLLRKYTISVKGRWFILAG